MENSGASPVEVQEKLKGVDYPASKQDLIDHVSKGKGKNGEVAAMLKKIPDKKYNSPVDVSKAIGDL